MAVEYVGSRQGSLPTKNSLYKLQNFNRPTRQCGRCGKPFHPLHQCPAREAVCRKCFKKGHFQHTCRSKSVAMISANDADYEFLGAVTSSQVDATSTGGKPWVVYLHLSNHLMKFKIDSGADVTVITEADYLEA